VLDGKFVRLAPDIAGSVAGNLASATVPVRLAAGKLEFSSSMVPVESGSVIVRSVLVFGAVTVKTPVPLACPVIFTFAIYCSYAITQVLPVGMVTLYPVSMVIGPALRAFEPLAML